MILAGTIHGVRFSIGADGIQAEDEFTQRIVATLFATIDTSPARGDPLLQLREVMEDVFQDNLTITRMQLTRIPEGAVT